MNKGAEVSAYVQDFLILEFCYVHMILPSCTLMTAEYLKFNQINTDHKDTS